mmetsp:Transcript_5850/g.8662  ORF Transcript_5850/g.8662 Transcript_5850/m.8662 type:complete len:81 (-) Transcript_5850:73-315(-)
MVEAEKKKENNQKMHEDSLESKDDSKTMNGPVKKVAKGNALTDTPTEDKDFVAVQVDELWKVSMMNFIDRSTLSTFFGGY